MTKFWSNSNIFFLIFLAKICGWISPELPLEVNSDVVQLHMFLFYFRDIRIRDQFLPSKKFGLSRASGCYES